MKDTERERESERERGKDRQGEKKVPCREPSVGLDPGTTGSHPEPKADSQPLSRPGIPIFIIIIVSPTCCQCWTWGFALCTRVYTLMEIL